MNRYEIGFIVEQALGHVTHTQNLREAVADDKKVDAHWILPAWETEGLAARLPFYSSNWTVRAGWQARRGLARLARSVDLDALFFHTQVTAMLAPDWLRRRPSVVSLDATPHQYDRLGDHYDHEKGTAWMEQAKLHLARRVFQEATALVTWSAWAKKGLVDAYGVDGDKVHVIPPGVDTAWWARPAPRRPVAERPLRILFVGGDLERKGGPLLLAAFRRLRAEAVPLELHLVTRTPVPAEPGVFVYNDMTPNSERLRALFFESDIFSLPTQADTLGLVLAEAGASGLPLVATGMAGVPEIVRHGETGLLIPAGDEEALVNALRCLIDTPERRLALGRRAAAHIRATYDAATNTRCLLDLLKEVAQVGAINQALAQGLTPDSTSSHKVAPAAGEPNGAPATLLTVSGTIPPTLPEELTGTGKRLPDYAAMAATFPADLLDYEMARPVAGPIGRLLERLAGPEVMLAWACFRLRHHYRVLFTDGEGVGLPLAFLLKFLGRERNRPRHLMITHRISVPKKQRLLDLLHLQTHVDRFIVYSRWQKRFVETRWQVPGGRVNFTPFMVDGDFFDAEQLATEKSLPEALANLGRPLISAVGLEFRDYPTLMDAVRGLDVQVVIAAASPWSKRENSAAGEEIPPNVVVRRFSHAELRHLYRMSDFVVVPLYDVDFQAGITAILEAMAMGKAQICSRTPGQTDVLVEGETALYVPPEDAGALRQAIEYLLAHPEEADAMGAAARREVEEYLDLRHYVRRLRAIVREEEMVQFSSNGQGGGL